MTRMKKCGDLRTGKNLINGNVCIKYMGIFIYVTMTNTHLTYLLSFSGTFNTSRNEIHVFTIFFLPIDSILLHFLKGKHRLDIISIGDGENLNSNERYFIICSKLYGLVFKNLFF